MPLDPRIILGGQQVQIDGPMDLMSQGMTMKNLANQNEMSKIKMAQAKQNAPIERATKEMELARNVTQGIYDKDSYQRGRKALLNAGIESANQWPKEYDPKFMKQVKLASMSPEAQQKMKRFDADQVWKQKEHDLNLAKFNREKSGMGKAPSGYRFTSDNTLEAIPGGPEAQKQADLVAKKQLSQDMQKSSGNQMADDIYGALEFMKDGNGVGEIEGNFKYIPGTDAYTLDNKLKPIQANIGFDRLQQMREASPTGGALGSVSDKEIETLQAVRGRIQTATNKEDLELNLKRLYNSYMDVIHGKNQGGGRYTENKNSDGRITGYGSLEKQSTQMLAKDNPNEVERQSKDGRISIFDAKTKQFLRYK